MFPVQFLPLSQHLRSYPSFSSLPPLYVLSIDAIWGCRPRPLELQIYPAAHVTNRGAQSSQNSPNSNWWKGGPSGSYQGPISDNKLNIMCTPITHADPAGCSSIYLDSRLKSLSFKFLNNYCGWNVFFHTTVHSMCLLITMDLWCGKTRRLYDPYNKEQHRNMYWYETWKALMMWIMC